MERPENLKVGDKFVVGLDSNGDQHHSFAQGEVVSLNWDDKTSAPEFVNKDNTLAYIDFNRLTPYQETKVKVDKLLGLANFHVKVETEGQFREVWDALVDAGFRVSPHPAEHRYRGIIKYSSCLNYIWASGVVDYKEFTYADLLTDWVQPAQEHSVPMTMEDVYKIVELDKQVKADEQVVDKAKEILENHTQQLNQLKAKYNIQ